MTQRICQYCHHQQEVFACRAICTGCQQEHTQWHELGAKLPLLLRWQCNKCHTKRDLWDNVQQPTCAGCGIQRRRSAGIEWVKNTQSEDGTVQMLLSRFYSRFMTSDVETLKKDLQSYCENVQKLLSRHGKFFFKAQNIQILLTAVSQVATSAVQTQIFLWTLLVMCGNMKLFTKQLQQDVQKNCQTQTRFMGYFTTAQMLLQANNQQCQQAGSILAKIMTRHLLAPYQTIVPRLTVTVRIKRSGTTSRKRSRSHRQEAGITTIEI